MAGRRFLVAFVEAGRPAAGSAVLQQRLDAIAAAAGIRALHWERRLATGADLVVSDAPLDDARAARLLELARTRDDVEYAEADAMMTIATGGPVLPAGPPG